MITQPYNQPPGRGERIAIGGYKPQYLAAVFFALKQLREGSLEELRLADLDAGRVDDLLIFTKSKELLAFQMKAESGEIKYVDFVNQVGDSGLLIDLVDGWQRLKHTYKDRRIKIYFLTSQVPSTSTHRSIYLPQDDPPPRTPSFAAFLEETWLPYREALIRNDPFTVPAGWQPAFDWWQQVSGLTPTEFEELAKAVELQFDFSFPTIKEVDVYAARRDSTGLYYYFQDKVAEAKRSNKPIIISEDDLKNFLGKERFEQRNIHYFRVPDWYCPITSSVEELQATLQRCESGYIALLGSPGSGKSSLLTRTLVESPGEERIVRYYAYVPDEREYGAPPRGEAVNFFQDVTQQLEQYGFRVGKRLPELNLDILRKRFGLQLQRLADDYSASKRKTVILIDGLDHIAREQQDRVDRTLLVELPTPSQVPPGIIFILGSQHLHGLPGAILAQLREEDRIINIQPLSLMQTTEVLEASGVWKVVQREAAYGYRDEAGTVLHDIYGLTQGHPLALAYLINQFIDAARTGAPLLDVLKTAIPYDGDIHDQYWSHWQQIDQEYRVELRDLVGLLARLRRAIDFQWLHQSWPERKAIHLLESKFRHFFRRDHQGYWQFFHNSFKQFLLARSTETIDGRDPIEEIRFHQILGERCQAAVDRPLVHWETLFHFWKAQRYEEACDTATRDFFERQIVALRPPDEVVNDARLSLVAAARLHDAIRLFRALFILSECTERRSGLEGYDEMLLETLTDLGEVGKALRWLVDGQKLRLRDSWTSIESVQEKAIKFSLKLAKAGFTEEGHELFNLAEPLHLLRGGKPISVEPHRENANVLDAWVSAAAFYRETSDVIAQIQRLEWEPPTYSLDEAEKQPTSLWRNHLLRELGASLISLGRLENALQVARTIDFRQEFPYWWLWFLLYGDLWWQAYEQDQHNLARELVSVACSVFELNDLRERIVELRSQVEELERQDDAELQGESTRKTESRLIRREIRTIQKLRVNLAEAVYHICENSGLALAWIDDIQWSELQSEDRLTKGMLDGLIELLALYSLTHTLGGTPPTSKEIAASIEYGDERTSLVQAALQVARLRGDRWAKRPYYPYEFGGIASSVLSLYCTSETRKQGPLLRSELTTLLEWLIHEAAAWGNDALAVVREKLKGFWADPGSNKYWYPYLRRSVLLTLFDCEFDEWANVEIQKSLQDEITDEDIAGQIEESLKRAQIWLSLGNKDQAADWVNNAVDVSLGITHDEDYQLSLWVDWLGRRNELEPAQEAERIETYAHRAIALDRTQRGSAANEAAMKLLEVTREWSPVRSVGLFWWLFDQNCLWYFGAVKKWVIWYLDQAEKNSKLELALAFVLLNAIYLPWWKKDEDSTILTRLLHLVAKKGRERLEFEASRLIKIISTETTPQARPSLLRELAKALRQHGVDIYISVDEKIEESPDDSNEVQTPSEGPILVLSDDKSLTLPEVIEQVRDDYHRLSSLVSDEQVPRQSYSRFPWGDVVSTLARGLKTAEEIMDVANYTCSLADYGVVLPLAERAAEIGLMELAHDLAMLALDVSNPGDWIRHWNYGSKERSYSILIQVNANKYRPQAFEAFADDVEKGEFRFHTSMLTHGFDRLFSIFCAPALKLEMCKLIEEHVAELFKATSVDNERLNFLLKPVAGIDGPLESTFRLLISHLSFPISEIRLRVLRALTELCLEHPELTIPAIQDGLAESEAIQERLLALCEAVAHRNSIILEPLLETMRALVYSDHFGIAATAQRVLSLCGESVPLLEPLVAIPTVSAISDVILMPDGLDDLPGHSLSASDKDRVAPFWTQVDVLARASGIKQQTAFRLCAQILDDWGDTPEKLEEEERLFRWRTDSIRLTYIRPRATAALRAVHHLATRLRRHGLLSDEDAMEIAQLFFNHFDPDMVLWYASPRPDDIVAIELADRTYKETWASRLQEIDGLTVCPQRDTNGWIILAESISLEANYHNCWEHRYVTTIVPRTADPLQEIADSVTPDLRHLNTPGCLISGYPWETCSDYRDGPIRVTFQSWADWFETRGKDWISLRPDLARHMGWQPVPNDPLSWQTETGELVIQSFGWQDGTQNADRLSPEVGHGWRVIISPEAWAALLSVLPSHPWRIVDIERGFEGEYEPRSIQRWCELIMLDVILRG